MPSTFIAAAFGSLKNTLSTCSMVSAAVGEDARLCRVSARVQRPAKGEVGLFRIL